MSDSARQLQQHARLLGVDLNDGQIESLLRFARLLDRWSAVYNLSAVRGDEAILTLHVADCLAAVAPLDRWAAGRALRILDVGSGAGLPGIVLAVARPRWAVTTIDAVAKKVAFARQAAGELGLANLTAEHGRVESMADDRFDVVISRAFSTLADLVSATAHLLRPGGVWVAMKGVRPDREIAALPAHSTVFHVEPLQVPGLEAARCLVWIRPN